MKFGVCVANVEEAKIAEEAGFDFVECQVVSLVPEESEEAFQKVLNEYKKLSIPVKACNVFLPGDLKIVGENIDQKRIENYVKTALNRVKELGAETVVFGSGDARTISESEYPREKVEGQIIEFLQLVADEAKRFGLTIVIEPLNKKESNIINSVSEGVEFAEKINRPEIQVLADFYHMDEEQEPITDIVKNKDYLKHIHLADTHRHQPGTGSYPYDEFVRCVKEANYNNKLCIESIWTEFNVEELQKSLTFIKEQFQ
ncbi:sugar phosphate isomerase/epimerase family protein [Pseudogracilibacillus sp. SE30717A]|uniref:sugar phosphate isomerase/epimerase family protein n=1 Tax=Pseudogracilibacillus sp. SE30717A TaxID=3098293 RepID=UPI00300E615F